MKWKGIPVDNGAGKEYAFVIVFECGDLPMLHVWLLDRI